LVSDLLDDSKQFLEVRVLEDRLTVKGIVEPVDHLQDFNSFLGKLFQKIGQLFS
jgi:hypothetical protein